MLNKEAVQKSKSLDKQAIADIKEILCLQCFNDSSIPETTMYPYHAVLSLEALNLLLA